MKKQLSMLGIIILMITLCVLFRLTFITGHSMEDTLKDGQVYVSTPVFGEIKRNDIVVVDVKDIIGQIIIKRVVGIPGDVIEIKDNELFINGEFVEEPYIFEPMITADIVVELADDEYFVCGDNRNNSLDSRSEIIDSIKRERIVYKIIK